MVSAAEDFWDDADKAQRIMQKITKLKEQMSIYQELKSKYDDLLTWCQLGIEEDDSSVNHEVINGFKELKSLLSERELELLLSGPYDNASAIISLHAGAGGTEAQDWVQMLYRMYSRWAEEKGYRLATIDFLPGDEAGIKSVTAIISGENVYGYLKAEKGVHRLVRISPFDASGRRHTSFASVDVLPEVDEDIDIKIEATDLKIDTFRAGGAGGQHVNKTDSAVRITHLPTGIVVQCQNERSQLSNKNQAMKLLKAKLADLELRKKEAELHNIRGVQQEIGWGSQIRSYVFHPYSLVKDHRTNIEVGNVDAVMNGEIDPFISAYLQKQAQERH